MNANFFRKSKSMIKFNHVYIVDSFHEIGFYDIPAFIDKILSVTGYPKLFYIGHSMGTTVFLVMSSLRPEYSKKVKAAILLAPVATTPNLQDLTSGIVRLMLQQGDLIYNTFKRAGIHEFLPRTHQSIKALRQVCGPSNTQDFCLDFLGMGYGEHRDNLDRGKIGTQVSYLPAGASAKTAHHLSQIYNSGFRLYNYGAEGNLRRYQSPQPPQYPLKNINVPIALIWGPNDVLVNKKSVEELAAILPNVIETYETPDPKFSHMDFVFGLNSKKIVNEHVIYLLQKYL